MVRWRSGTVTAVRRSWHGAVELDVRQSDGAQVRALAYPELVGTPEPGDRVLLNVGALLMGLGTGGYALVVALPDRLPADPPRTVDTRDAGHLVKARYTPLQPILLGVDEEASPHRAALVDADDLGGLPVVTADLHSALPAIVAGIRADAPDVRIGYLWTDGGALPAWFSRTLHGLRADLAGTVTVGQAFGGDLEATNLHSGLLAARHVLRADVAIVAQGPGNLGTGTRWGFSGVAVGEAVNAVAALGGRPVGSLRISGADPRDRHRGLSHHSVTAYGRVALATADLVLPAELPAELAALVEPAVAALAGRHRIVRVPVHGLDEALRASPVPLSTMGRGLAEEHAYFLAAAAAGRYAARLR
ncbi:DUF3866 family protein [Plantactinospora sp. KLBMP9567]|uniref:DUF3866 family protein n=1 Tax=Plantactinospora sp. KLBMP9567 TaxID=3085900 RepID=UPI002981F8E5|nr:DUF3866 family protein [Plantactinospora sp. KLBMP9567]MDW5325886.1 DUF3866 family protein [Plantactinospora sp. KLBMP9567]